MGTAGKNLTGFNFEEKVIFGFKRKPYLKLVQSLELKVEYVYALSNWFKNRNIRVF
jgi:hypothetical protein